MMVSPSLPLEASPLLWRHRMVGELEVPIVAAGAAALMAIDDLEQIPVQAGLIRPEPLYQFGDIKNRPAPAAEAMDGQTRSGFKLSAESVFDERVFV
jgi:hypothetical protein